jgi:predicted phosphodiesterase
MARINKTQLVRDYLDQDKYFAMPHLTLAKIIYKENKELFTTITNARNKIQYLRGCGCQKDRNKPNFKRDVAKYGKAPVPTRREKAMPVPEGKKHWDWAPINMRTESMLILSDVHVPYHEPKALEAACEYGEEVGVDTVLLNGDFCDFWSISRWESNPKERDFKGELKIIKKCFEYIRSVFPTERIILKLGNHEERYEKYMMLKAVELLDIDAFSIEQILGLRNFDIDMVGQKKPIIANGRYCIIHGHEYYGGASQVNHARAYMQKTKMNTISGHLHRPMDHIENCPDGTTINSYASGCLCDLKPDYSPLNNWAHSFIHLFKQDKDTHVKNIRIIDGKIV